MKSLIVKRSVCLDSHKTSVSLEAAFWNTLKTIAHQRHETLSDVVVAIDAQRDHGNLSSAIRLFVLDWAINGGAHAHSESVANHQRRTATA